MEQQHVSQKGRKARKQRGVTILQILIGTVVGAVALVASINAIQGQRADAEQAETVQFAVTEVSSTISAIYYNSGRTYGTNTAPKSGLYALGVAGTLATQNAGVAGSLANALANTKGLRTVLPSGDNWGLNAGGTAGTQVILYLGCAQGAGTAANRCGQLAEAVRGAGSRMILAGTDVTVNATTAGSEFVQVTFNRPA